MVVALFGPTIDVGPLGALATWSVVILGIIAVLGSVTLGGAMVFILLGLLGVLVLFFAAKRLIGRLEGRR
jgi:hypothetical protein